MSLTSEMRGIAPRTSGLLSRRSTIRPTSHVYQISRNFFFAQSATLKFFFSFAEKKMRTHLLGISICKKLYGDSDYHLLSGSKFGDAVH